MCRDSKGRLVGFLASVDHPASRIIGPGVSENEEVALILLRHLLDSFRGKCPLFLLPVKSQKAVQPHIHGVPEIARFIFLSARVNINHPRGCHADIHA